MNVPPSLGERLREGGHSCQHAGGSGLADAPDSEILTAAREAGAVLLTHDLDFGRLLAFSGASRPSVVIFRGVDNHPSALLDQLQRCWSELEEPLEEGAVVVLEMEALRVRPLPISEGPS